MDTPNETRPGGLYWNAQIKKHVDAEGKVVEDAPAKPDADTPANAQPGAAGAKSEAQKIGEAMVAAFLTAQASTASEIAPLNSNSADEKDVDPKKAGATGNSGKPS